MANQGDLIKHNGTQAGLTRVKSQSGHGSSDTWYNHFFCGNSLALYVEAAYDFWGSDHIWMVARRWSISENKWITIREINYLNGKNHQSYILYVNCKAPASATYANSYDGIDSIHFCLSTRRIRWGAGNDKGSTNYGYMGNYNTMSLDAYNRYLQNKKIYGKKLTGSNGGILWHTTSGLPNNPFDTDWGNVSTARGEQVVASDPNRLIYY